MQNVETLFDNLKFVPLFKGHQDDNGDYRFAGVASDESPDSSPERDAILRKHLDVTYAQTHGYVNWDHGRGPEDQIGALTKAVIIPPEQLNTYSALAGVELPDTASLWVEGVLYKHQPRAQSVVNMLKSVEDGTVPFGKGPGLSIDGSAIRNVQGKMQKAIVRGVAITPSPAHTSTFCNLVKSLLQTNDEVGDVETGLVKTIDCLTYEEAVVTVLEMRPEMPFALAKQIVDYTIQQKRGA